MQCFEVECDGCGDGWADSDYGTPHFPAENDLASGLADWHWTVEDGKHYCRGCTNERTCAREGHQPHVLPAVRCEDGRTFPELIICGRCDHRLGAAPRSLLGDKENN